MGAPQPLPAARRRIIAQAFACGSTVRVSLPAPRPIVRNDGPLGSPRRPARSGREDGEDTGRQQHQVDDAREQVRPSSAVGDDGDDETKGHQHAGACGYSQLERLPNPERCESNHRHGQPDGGHRAAECEVDAPLERPDFPEWDYTILAWVRSTY